jgi:hypothetical protein
MEGWEKDDGIPVGNRRRGPVCGILGRHVRLRIPARDGRQRHHVGVLAHRLRRHGHVSRGLGVNYELAPEQSANREISQAPNEAD